MKIQNKKDGIGTIGDREIERTNALTLISDSKEYYDYYLRGKPDTRADINKVSYFLLMRSLELSLKAMVKIREGLPINEIKNKYSHNVFRIYSYCVDKKYIKSDGKEEGLAIEILSDFYKLKDFEYTKVGYKSLPKLFYIINLLERVYVEFNSITQNTKLQKYL